MTGLKSFQRYHSVAAAERGERQQAEHELRTAINNHADNLLSLNGQVAKLTDQMDAVLDSLTQINGRLDALEQTRG